MGIIPGANGPLRTIGLCLSGGGHRATAFSLGALLNLSDAGLLGRVKTVASVSGGSLASGYFATREKPLNRLTPEDMEAAARTLARMLAGRPWAFGTTLAVLLVLWGVWTALLLFNLATEISLGRLNAVLFLLLVLVAWVGAHATGGTFWAWWGTWLYLGTLLAGPVVALSLWRSDMSWGWALIATLLASCLPLARSRVAQMAFRATLFKHGKWQRLAELPETPRFVFCATEMHSGRHTFFSSDLVFDPLLGIGEPGTLAVSSAVQISANFPPLFPYRLLRVSRFKFKFATPSWDRQEFFFLVLTDGGVHDNMGTSWFLDGPEYGADLQQRASHTNEYAQIQKQVDALLHAMADELIVVNSSEPYQWRRAGQSAIPLWGEVRILAHMSNSMYNQIGFSQLRRLRRMFFSNANTGALLSIGEPPQALVAHLTNSTLWSRLINEFGLHNKDMKGPRERAARIRTRVQAPTEGEQRLARTASDLGKIAGRLPADSKMRTELEAVAASVDWSRSNLTDARQSAGLLAAQEAIGTAQQERARALQSESVATTFRPLGIETTATLLAHGYRSAMINCHLLLDTPLVDSVFDDFRRLAGGRPRTHGQ